MFQQDNNLRLVGRVDVGVHTYVRGVSRITKPYLLIQRIIDSTVFLIFYDNIYSVILRDYPCDNLPTACRGYAKLGEIIIGYQPRVEMGEGYVGQKL